jgi:carbon-monoxide dehydrogenase small subunit
MTTAKISLTLNDRPVEANVEPRTHLADFLREDQLLTGTHVGCEQGVCGACTVMIDGRPSRSCITLAAACDAADIRTIESFDDDPLMARLRDAFSRHHGLQCGYCTPGMLATAYDIVRRVPDADSDRIRRELSGNLCRCTGYAGAVAAVADVLAQKPPAALLQPMPRTRQTARSVASPQVISSVSARADVPVPITAPAMQIPDVVADGIGLSREVAIDASPEAVWRILEDIPTLVTCIPGAQLSGAMTGSRAIGFVTVALGPIRSNFDGAANIITSSETRTGSAIGRGIDKLTRSTLDGSLEFALSEAATPDKSRLKFDAVYRLTGPLAQFGRPTVVAAIADKILSDMSDAISAKANGRDIAPVGGSTRQSPPALNGFAFAWIAIKGLFKGLWRRT